MSFLPFPQGLDEADAGRDAYKNPLFFGNSFLDAALGGIFPDDMIIVTARTGGGKTELVTQIALTNSLAGKQVHYFALEAHPGEIQTRIKFKLLSQAFFSQQNWRSYDDTPSYQAWMHHKQDGLLAKFEPEINQELKARLKTLNILYREKSFDGESFESHMTRIGETSDLIIIDHLHYFDLSSENENLALKKTVKLIKDVTSHYRKPTILVVQLRKQDKKLRSLLPDLEDIHGSSDVAKIATKILATAPARDEQRIEKHIYPTYFRVLKNRTDGSRCFYAALCGFDARRNLYSRDFRLGELSADDSEFKQIEQHEYPRWARI